MPILTRWFVKASFVYLVAALLTGLLLAGEAVFPVPPLVASLGPEYIHFFMLSWVAQLIFGVVYWMFPKYTRESPHRSDALAWAVFALLNAGLVLRAIAEPGNSLRPGSAWAWGLALSAAIQWCAGLAFVINTWARVKER